MQIQAAERQSAVYVRQSKPGAGDGEILVLNYNAISLGNISSKHKIEYQMIYVMK